MHDASDTPGGRKSTTRTRVGRNRKHEPSGASARSVSFLLFFYYLRHHMAFSPLIALGIRDERFIVFMFLTITLRGMNDAYLCLFHRA